MGEYYTHIICVFTKIRGLYSGQKTFIITVVRACGYRLQVAATDANAKNVIAGPIRLLSDFRVTRTEYVSPLESDLGEVYCSTM